MNRKPAILFMNAPSGLTSLIKTVDGFGVSIDATTGAKNGRRVLLLTGSMIRSIEYFTSSEVKGSPLWNRMPFFSVNVYVSPSGDSLNDSAIRGTMLPLKSKP